MRTEGRRRPGAAPEAALPACVFHAPWLVAHPLRVPVRHGLVLLGRWPGAALVVDEARVSPVHASLQCRASGWWLVDHASRNGTWCNGLRTHRPLPVRVGDQLGLGGPERVLTVRSLPPVSAETPLPPTAAAPPSVEPGALRLRLRVSRDQESVSLEAAVDGQRAALGVRVHHQLLLHLARRRAADRARLPSGEQGWCGQRELARELRVRDKTLNLQVHRARQQLAAALGPEAAAQLIERRPATRELRLGTPHVAVEPT